MSERIERTAVTMRLPVDLAAKVDAFQAHLKRERPGQTVTRTDAVCVLLWRGLDEDPKPPRAKRKAVR